VVGAVDREECYAYRRGRLGVDLRRVPLDLKAVVQEAFDSGMPHAEWWASDWKQ
jgi:hypothetical protein